MDIKGSPSRVGSQWTRICIALAICQSSLGTDMNDTSQLRRHRQLPVVQSRIVGGREVPVGKFSFFAFWYGAKCGATLVHTDVFLTAAHVSLK
jgi:Trypsin